MPVIDPVISLVLSFAASAVFLHGAWSKWQERELFAAAMQGYDLIPDVTVPTASTTLVVAEAAIGVLLCLQLGHPLPQLMAIALLALVSAAVVVNLLRGRTEISCGCGGSSADQQISWGLVARNVVFAGSLALAAMPLTARELHFADNLFIVFGALMLLGLYAAASQLVANGPRLAALRNA